MNIFEMLNEEYHLPKKPKLFEAFSGIGCQRMAFDRLGIDYEMVGVSEIDKYALESYMAIHGETKNFGSITDIKELPQVDVFTWSFPCTDLSKAGKQKGLGDTRSGLVYEVLRILQNTKEKPKVLIMENVVDLVQAKFIHEFNEIQLELENMGYKNYVEKLNAKDYGVAQNRDRVFMVSILGDYYYNFPKPIELEKRLKDYLEGNVDEKYYLSDKAIEGMKKTTFSSSSEKNLIQDVNGVSSTLCARDYKGPKCVRIGGLYDDKKGKHQAGSIWDHNELSPTIDTMQGGNRQPFIVVPEKTIKGYTEAYEGDGVYTNRPHQKRGVVQKGMIQTIKANNGDIGVVVNKPVCLNSKVNGKQPSLTDRIYDSENIATCITTSQFYMPNYTEKIYSKKSIEKIKANITDVETMSKTITANPQRATIDSATLVERNLRIRKLTPKECWLLMGIDDDCFHKAEKVCSNSQLYKQAGNGIVVDVFAAIVKELI